MNNSPLKIQHLSFLMADLSSGGIQKVVLNLLKSLVKNNNFKIDLVVMNLEDNSSNDSFRRDIPDAVNIVNFKLPVAYRTKVYLKIIPALKQYLQQEKPDILFANLPLINVLTVMAKKWANVPTRLYLIEHTFFFNDIISIINQETIMNQNSVKKKTSRVLALLMRWLYPQGDKVIAVSHSLAQYIEKNLGLQTNSVQVIYNPVIDQQSLKQTQEFPDHPWLIAKEYPIFLAVGRLTLQKDFNTLITAFAQFRQKHLGKLLILGEGELKEELEQLIQTLHLENDVNLLGFVDNPYPYMSQATALILSSLWEGLPTVLIEAMACGCQMIATDCPYGPKEILQDNQYGFLIPVKDIQALTQSMEKVLKEPKDPNLLKERAKLFTIEQAVEQYLELIYQN